jgi:tRNA A-37 threonylcarbamoyl transferase component Bud32
MHAEKKQGEKVLARLKRRSGLVKTRDGSPNIVQSIIDAGIARVTEKLEQAAEAIKVSDLALASLDAYETSEEVEANTPSYYNPTNDQMQAVLSAFGSAFGQQGFQR